MNGLQVAGQMGKWVKKMYERKLGGEWQRIISDICGIRRPEKEDEISIHQTHLHRDHMALPGDLIDKRVTFKSPGALMDSLKWKSRNSNRGIYRCAESASHFIQPEAV